MARTPISNGIIYKVTEYDLLSTSIKPNNYYACTDSRKMYKDTSRNTRELLKVTMIDTEIDRVYNTRPVNGVTYYVWETNELWTYNGGWVIRIGEIQSRSSGYYYKDSDIFATDDPNQNAIIDNNGLLKDGSVVIRDINRVIKGRLYIDGTNNNLVISSFLGGGIRLLPNGYMDALGSLLINPNTLVEYVNTETGDKISSEEYEKLSDTQKEEYEEVITTVNDGYAIYRGEWNTTDDMYVNTDKYNQSGDSDIHKYKVWHEGNFDPNDLVLTAEDILHSLQTLSKPIDLDVDTVDGKHASDFADKVHSHTTSEITDFNDKLKDYVNSVMLGGNNKGIYVNYNLNTLKYDFTANSFNLVFSGGATGSGTVTNLTNTTIALTVDPDKHDHHYKLEDLDGYQDLIDEINKKIPKEDAVTTATPNKLLYLDATGYLPASITGNANTASKLQTARTIQLTSGVTGSAVFDGSSDINIVATVDPAQHQHNQYALIENIGKTIAPLDENQKVPVINLPDSVRDTLQYQGTFDPSTGLPSSAPVKGQYWVAVASSTGNNTINGREYYTGDWIVYNGTDWDYVDNQTYIRSINGNSDSNMTLSPSDIGAISDDYLDYNGASIPPANKLVLTDADGHMAITSEKADKLSKAFAIMTTEDSDVTIDSSSVAETDGSTDINLKLIVNPSIIPDLSMEQKASFKIDLDINGLLVQEVM